MGSPLVEKAKDMMGESNLLELRRDLMVAHTRLIAQGVESTKPYWKEPLFKYIDRNQNGCLDIEEMTTAIYLAGWADMNTPDAIANIMRNADLDGDGILSPVEFERVAAVILRKNLLKQANINANSLGLLN